MTQEEKEEFYSLQKYIGDCSGGDRPISPAARKLARYLELKEKINAEKSQNTNYRC